MIRYVGYIAAYVGAFWAGTAAHELVHHVAAEAVGARVDHVHWWPPNPAVVFEAPTERAHDIIQAAPVAVTVPLVLGLAWLMRDRPFWLKMAALVFAVAFFPRSAGDWRPYKALLFK